MSFFQHAVFHTFLICLSELERKNRVALSKILNRETNHSKRKGKTKSIESVVLAVYLSMKN